MQRQRPRNTGHTLLAKTFSEIGSSTPRKLVIYKQCVKINRNRYFRKLHLVFVMEKWGIRVNDLMTQAALPMSDGDTAGG
jgi:hypothetical protein